MMTLRELMNTCRAAAKKRYGDPLPRPVFDRLETELEAICRNPRTADALLLTVFVCRWMPHGRPVGFRGTIGSSFAAYLLGITEIDPLPPHYRCPRGHYFDCVNDGSVDTGAELPEKPCPICGEPLLRGGNDLPYETAFGPIGEKTLDIDLDICTAARGLLEDAAVAWVDDRWPRSEKTLVRRSEKLDVMTEVFAPDGERLLALVVSEAQDLLFALGEATGVSPEAVPLDDRRVWALFGETQAAVAALGLPPAQGRLEEQLRAKWAGTLGVPHCFDELLIDELHTGDGPAALARRMGYAMGIGAREGETILRSSGFDRSTLMPPSRDALLLLLRLGGVGCEAYEIAERIRRGRSLTEEEKAAMRQAGFPDAEIRALGEIRYLWPKGNLLQRANDAMRTAWYKLYHPLAFYAAYFTAHTGYFCGRGAAAGHGALIGSLSDPLLPILEEEEIDSLLVAEEMTARGFSFLAPEEGRSDETRFLSEGNALRIPLCCR